jgi:hypothetical protein
MTKSREEMIALLTNEYDKWEKIETHNVLRGAGMRGPNGNLSNIPFDELFNEIAWRLLTI